MSLGQNGPSKTVIIIDDWLDNATLNVLDDIVKGPLKKLNDKTGSHVNYYTEYDWNLVQCNLRDHEVKDVIFEKLSNIIGKPIPAQDLEPMQLFAKQFDENSYCAPHSEDPKFYGDWVFMLYLTDEVDGELCTEDLKILPKRNRLVLMRTGFEHWVEKCSGTRLNVSGWPFANKEVRNRWKK
jgi:hypothetical protein